MLDVDFLKDRAIFRGFDEKMLASLAAAGTERTFRRGEQIVGPTEPGTAMFMIRQGAADVTIIPDGGRHPRFTALLGPGEIFSELALLTGVPSGVDVYASSEVDTVCYVFEKESIDACIQKSPKIAKFLTEILRKRVQESGSMERVGKYRMLEEIGRGGAAIVFEGFHPGLNRSVAIKMLNHAFVAEGDSLKRIRQEARLIADLSHENIVQVFDTEVAYASFFIIMERLEGVELRDIIEEGPSSAEEVRHILRQTARALSYAHRRGIVHNDVKPSNIFIEATGRAKLMDFGIAAPTRNHATGRPPKGVMGTPGYIAPEVMHGTAVDGRADIYSLGIVATEMLLGGTAFPGMKKLDILRHQLKMECMSLPDEVAENHPELKLIIERATQQDPEKRYASCRDFLAALDERGGERLVDAGISNLTVVYNEEHRNDVQRVLQRAQRRLAHIDGVRVNRADSEVRAVEDTFPGSR